CTSSSGKETDCSASPARKIATHNGPKTNHTSRFTESTNSGGKSQNKRGESSRLGRNSTKIVAAKNNTDTQTGSNSSRGDMASKASATQLKPIHTLPRAGRFHNISAAAPVM